MFSNLVTWTFTLFSLGYVKIFKFVAYLFINYFYFNLRLIFHSKPLICTVDLNIKLVLLSLIFY